MTIIVGVYLFVLGLALGSFALAMVDRMHAGKDWVKSRSACDSCRRVLGPKDLIPLVSWLSQKGRCRYCSVRLSASYPLVELFSGLAFLVAYVWWPLELNSWLVIVQFVIWLLALVIMTALIVFDLRWFLLPNKLIYPLIGLSALYAGLELARVGFDGMSSVVSYLLALLVGAGFFGLLWAVSNGTWIGDGDVRFGFAIGLFSGSAALAWFTIFTASIIGIGFSIVGLAHYQKKKGKKSQSRMKLEIPFGPSLIIALYITMLFGQRVVDWYSSTILQI